jgi:hypothetical protein
MALREELAKTQDEAEWGWLQPHLKRDVVIYVKESLDLLQVAVEVAQNETAKITYYLSSGALSKPTQAQIDTWNLSLQKKFMVIIVQPFVLIQLLPEKVQTLH